MQFINRKTERKKIEANKSLKEGEKKPKVSKKTKKMVIHNEGYKDKKILDLSNIPEFNSLDKLEPPFSDLSLFETKKYAEKYFKEGKYNIEDILEYDDTNKNIMKKYLELAIQELNCNKNLEKKNIILEKIQKCGIILDKNEYDNEIKKINDKELKENLIYIDYKLSIINVLDYIKSNPEGNNIEAKEKLRINKIFIFNHDSQLGNDNYYFYGLARQLGNKIEELLKKPGLYSYIIEKSIDFFKKDFSKLTKYEVYIFKYISYILLEKNSIKSKKGLDEIKNFIEGRKVTNINELKKAIKFKNDEEELNNELIKSDKIVYSIDYNNDYLEYKIKEDNKIDRKLYSNQYIKRYKLDMFNDKIIESIKSCSLNNFEGEIFRKILPDPDNSFKFFEETKTLIFQILTKLLKSQAAKDFFAEYYANKYNKNNKIIEYHFDRDEVIDEIKKRIEFYPIFDSKTKANTNPTDLTIIINSIPGKFDPEDTINYFNKNILQIGRIIVFLVHEIFGHFLRRYYHYITNGIIKMDTYDDDIIITKPEGGFFAEEKFLGFQTKTELYLKDALYFLFYGINLEKYPIIKKDNITKENLKTIINDNPEIFYFIKEESKKNVISDEKMIKEEISKNIGKNIKGEEKIEEVEEEYDVEDSEEEEDEEEDKGEKTSKGKEKRDDNKKDQKDKITVEQYYNFLNPVRDKFPSIISCGFRKEEKYIEL